MSARELASLARQDAFRPTGRFELLAEDHVPFDELTGAARHERLLIETVTESEGLCLVFGASGTGKTSLVSWAFHHLPNAYDFFSPDEIEQLSDAAASPQDRAIYRTAAFTGLRMGELIALRWGDIDFDTEALHVYNSYSLGTLTAPKSGLTRTVPMAEQVQELLEAHGNTVPHDRGDLVFRGERAEYLDGAALRRRYKKALEKAELRKLRFHA